MLRLSGITAPQIWHAVGSAAREELWRLDMEPWGILDSNALAAWSKDILFVLLQGGVMTVSLLLPSCAGSVDDGSA